MTFLFDGGLALRCEACGWRFYAGPWDLTEGWWISPIQATRRGRWNAQALTHHRSCYLCGDEMVATHRGTADDWELIKPIEPGRVQTMLVREDGCVCIRYADTDEVAWQAVLCPVHSQAFA